MKESEMDMTKTCNFIVLWFKFDVSTNKGDWIVFLNVTNNLFRQRKVKCTFKDSLRCLNNPFKEEPSRKRDKWLHGEDVCRKSS